jgi:hypothetical protein
MNNTQSINSALINQIIESGSNLPLGTLTGNIDLLIKSAELDGFTQAKEIMFPSITEPELKAKDLKAGEWYIITHTSTINFDIHIISLIKIIDIILNDLVGFKAANCINGVVYDYSNALCPIQNVLSIRHATREEIIKYFPNEFEIDTHGGNDISQLTDHPNTI